MVRGERNQKKKISSPFTSETKCYFEEAEEEREPKPKKKVKALMVKDQQRWQTNQVFHFAAIIN